LTDFQEAPMTVTIAVAPARLRHAAVVVRAVGGRLLEVRGQLGASVAGLDPALGGPGARAAFATLWAQWSGSLEALASEVIALTGALEAAVEAYERADRSLPGTDSAGARGGVDASDR
jgi:uncharacterized protein YukE